MRRKHNGRKWVRCDEHLQCECHSTAYPGNSDIRLRNILGDAKSRNKYLFKLCFATTISRRFMGDCIDIAPIYGDGQR